MLKGDIASYVKDSIKCNNEIGNLSNFVSKKKEQISELEGKVC